ncbi:TetR family transcriptional regulator [Saccharomonospora xinjiangensis]|uniref:TetR family transcriptional regulator n=1 Tax=Saccharomonospora xinjiangensis TaxID=75294 RepID=UPI00350FB8EB
MAWNTERTRKLLLDAAVEEFSAKGFAGARIDRIAAGAAVNKERIYQYFGNKEALFDAALLAELDRLADAVPLDGDTPDALAAYAGDVFDYYVDRPHLARLLYWEGLERGDHQVPGEQHRRDRYRKKVDAVAGTLGPGGGDDAQQVLLTVIGLASSWHVLPQLNRMILDDIDPAARRETVVECVRALAERTAARHRAGRG